jgi:hypothetical protein
MNQSLPDISAKNMVWQLALVALMSGCNGLFGKEVARLPINVVSTDGHDVVKEATLQLKKDDEVAVWSDMDLAYEGASPVRFQVVVTKDGEPFKQLEIDPTEKNVTVGEVKSTVNDHVNWRFTGKNAVLTIPVNGAYLFKARLIAAPNPTLKITKAELVLKK